jgi:hypothetical protein
MDLTTKPKNAFGSKSVRLALHPFISTTHGIFSFSRVIATISVRLASWISIVALVGCVLSTAMWAVPLTQRPRFLLTLLQINAEDTTFSKFITYCAYSLYSVVNWTFNITDTTEFIKHVSNNKKEILLSLMKDIHFLLLTPSHILEKG